MINIPKTQSSIVLIAFLSLTKNVCDVVICIIYYDPLEPAIKRNKHAITFNELVGEILLSIFPIGNY